MIFKHITSGLMLLCVAISADAYQYEVEVKREDNDGAFVDVEQTSIAGTFYLAPVESSDVPLAETAFATRVSSITLGFDRQSSDLNPATLAQPFQATPILNLDALDAIIGNPNFVNLPAAVFAAPTSFILADPDSDRYSVGGRYILAPDWFIEATIGKRSANENNEFESVDRDADEIRFAAGSYVLPLTTVSVAYTRSSDERNSLRTTLFGLFPPSIPAQSFTIESFNENEEQRWAISGKHIIEAERSHHVISASFSYAVIESKFRSVAMATGNNIVLPDFPSLTEFTNKSYATHSDFRYVYYPTRQLGVGVSWNNVDAEFGSSDSYRLHGEWFFQQNFAARLSGGRASDQLSNQDTDYFAIGLTGRF